MANILDIRRRIRSVTNTRQITRAMKMVSAARLRRAQERALAARPYAQMLTNVLKSLVSRADVYDPHTGEALHPLLLKRPEENVLLLVITGDKGLAGAFNANILKAAMRFLESKQGRNIEIEAVGRKGRDFLRRRFRGAEPRKSGSQGPPRTTLAGERVGVLNRIEYALASEIAEQIIERYTHAEIDSVYLVYNEFKSVIAQRLVVEQLLPVEEIGTPRVAEAREMELEEKKRAIEAARGAGVGLRPADTREIDEHAAAFAAAPVDYIYEQPPKDLFRSLLPKYVGIQIFHALLESVAAEHAARMTAMESATNNASEMIDSLTLAMNRARQAKITKEIIEIVSGAAAL
ncbi:MAG TPA: ATP synthase F1 subunit gamma [Terriglobales bacterium]|nr:ATP synthase F1 subunit gamma [Terriglobales bacterium]